MARIGNAPSGEKTSSDGTEKLPISGNQWMLVSRIAAYIATLTQTLTNKTITAPTITAPTLSTTVLLTGIISPSQITSNQNDYNPTSLSTATVLRLNSDASRNITGLQGGASGRVIIIENVGSNAIVLKDEDTNSSAANRFALTADVTLSADSMVVLKYDSTSSRWRAVAGGGGAGGSSVSDAYILIRDEKTQNTAGGTFTSGSWQTRNLNTEVSDTGGYSSVSSNQITLAAGTYRANISAPAFHCGRHQARLQDITNTATLLIGTSEYIDTGDNNAVNRSVIVGRFTLSGSTVVEVQHQCQNTQATNGLGVEGNFTTEVYTVVELTKEQ